MNTVEQVTFLSTELRKFYLPCKARCYLTALTSKNVVTILRHFVKLHNYRVSSNEKYQKGEKFIVYVVVPNEVMINVNELLATANRSRNEEQLQTDPSMEFTPTQDRGVPPDQSVEDNNNIVLPITERKQQMVEKCTTVSFD